MDNIVIKTTKEYADEYVAAGFALCAIRPKSKGPYQKNWGDLTLDTEHLEQGEGLGLIHGRSGTCVVDIDDMAKAEPYFLACGINIEALLAAPDAVQINSNRSNRAKLLYKVPAGLTTLPTHKRLYEGFEFRCAARNGNAMQDVLPPSIHPETNLPYRWDGDGSFSNIPELPKPLYDLWLSLGTLASIGNPINRIKSDLDILDPMTPERWTDIKSALGSVPSDDREVWIAVGMALKPYDNGLELWDAWSSKSDKYDTNAIDHRWYGFDPQTITYKSIFKFANDNGWINPAKGVSKAEQAQVTRAVEIEQARESSVDDLTDGEGLYFDERNPPTVDKKFYMGDWIPEGGVTLLSGDGGVGKSFSSLNMAVCIALGLDYGDLPTRKSKVYFVTAEDDKDDVNARITNICANLLDAFNKPVDKRALDGQLLVWDVTKAAATFLFDEQGITTTLIKHADRARAYGARIMFFDNISNLYGADENKRSQVVGFIKGLTVEMIGKDDRAVDEIDLLAKKAVFLNGHTSKSNLGSIGAGSLAWQQAARFQLFIALKEIVVGKPMQPVLTAVKSNHSKLLSSVTLHWDRGAYVPLTQKGLEIQTTARKDDAFKDLKVDVLNALVAAIRGETEVSASRSGITKTALMLEKYGSFDKTIAEKELYKALDSLQKDGVILIETRSVKSNKRDFYLLADGWDLI